MHQGSVLSPLCLAVVADVATENAREGALREFLYGGDLVLMRESIEGVRNKFLKWKEAYESKDLKVSTHKNNAYICTQH